MKKIVIGIIIGVISFVCLTGCGNTSFVNTDNEVSNQTVSNELECLSNDDIKITLTDYNQGDFTFKIENVSNKTLNFDCYNATAFVGDERYAADCWACQSDIEPGAVAFVETEVVDAEGYYDFKGSGIDGITFKVNVYDNSYAYDKNYDFTIKTEQINY